MSKAKHFQVILRGQQQFLQQLHSSNTIAASTSTGASSTPTKATAGSLRVLNSRLIVNPGPNSCSCSIHTQAYSQPLKPFQQQQYQWKHSATQQQQQQQRHSYSSCQRHHPRARQRDSAVRLLHTSVPSRSLASPSPSTTAASAVASSSSSSSSPTSASSDPHQSDGSGSIHSPVSASSVGSNQGGAHVFTEQTSSAAQWISELPWIDPNTQTSYEPGHGPTTGEGSQTNQDGTSSSVSFFDQPFQNTRHNYVFAHGASGFAKNTGKAPTLTPEEDRAYHSVQVGEDSYFVRHDALGVADGVGGWSNTTGANPALYSRKLMHYAFLELEKYDNIEEDAFYDYFNVDPVQILEKSYEQSAVDAKKEGLIGSSTACLAILRDDELRIANLGDCGVSVIRRNEFVFRTEEQQHSFNYPYQLGTGSTDSPKDALIFTVKVESGDIVVMGTDGIFDNLFDEDILEEVVRCVSSVNTTPNTSPYGTGKPTPSSTTTVASSTLKSVGGLWSGLTSGAAKLASSSTSTIAAMAGKSTASASESTSTSAKEGAGDQSQLYQTLEEVESSSDLSPIAAAAIAAAESTALPPSAPQYTTASSYPSSSSTQRRQKVPEPSIISDALAKRAKNVGEDTRHHGSPFQSRAMQEGLYYQGGKRDDMSVLVAIVKVAEDSPDRR
ncbi:hypothetical protein BGX26_003117 [Mortierella sp. AD094]|nr:hypothetical protein BGX26_003117 [Mortierella sp. AD094]